MLPRDDLAQAFATRLREGPARGARRRFAWLGERLAPKTPGADGNNRVNGA